jgi:hypothetical protein
MRCIQGKFLEKILEENWRVARVRLWPRRAVEAGNFAKRYGGGVFYSAFDFLLRFRSIDLSDSGYSCRPIFPFGR